VAVITNITNTIRAELLFVSGLAPVDILRLPLDGDDGDSVCDDLGSFTARSAYRFANRRNQQATRAKYC
jgi:hypothetical protein